MPPSDKEDREANGDSDTHDDGRAGRRGERRAEMSRDEVAERYELALQSLSVGIWEWNLDERRLYWSSKYKQMLGIRDPGFQPAATSFMERLHPEDLDSVNAAVEGHIRKHLPFDIECRLRHEDGHYVWVRLCGLAERRRDGRARRMVGSVDDITIRKQAEQKLSEREARLRNMVEHAVDGLITIDTKGIIQTYNPACEALFGFTAGEVVGRNISILMPEPYRSGHDGYLEKYQRTGQAAIIGIGREVEGRRKDGSVFPIDLSISQFESAGETLFSGIVRDITHRKEVERVKSEFISIVSHELRTPLTSIRGALGLLANDTQSELPRRTLELLKIAHRNSERLVVLINDILDVDKLDSGKVKLALRPVLLQALLVEAVSANSAYAARYGVTLTLWLEPALPPVIADPDRLVQVMANLLSNAAKFTRAATSVDIRAERRENTVKISVRDHGEGVSESMAPVIFEKFSQGDYSNSRDRSGTGLGLSIARQVMHLMNGAIGFTSEPGKGATFHIELPIATSCEAPAGEIKARADPHVAYAAPPA